MPGYTDMAVGIEKLGLPSLKIPGLFIAEKISLFPDRSRTPSPPTSPPPPGLPHPSTPGMVRPTVVQNVRESSFAPVRRGSDPGMFNRSLIEGAASYKSAVQGKGFCGGDGHAKPIANLSKGSPTPPPIDNSDGAITGGGAHGSLLRRINPKIVSRSGLRLPWKWD